MNTREIAQEYRHSHWAAIIRQRAESGLTVKAFCQTIGIHGNTYFYWQKKLREAAYTEYQNKTIPEQQKFMMKPATETHPPVPAGWAVCKSTQPEPPDESITIEIGKSRIKVTAGTEPELLTKACSVLLALC